MPAFTLAKFVTNALLLQYQKGLFKSRLILGLTTVCFVSCLLISQVLAVTTESSSSTLSRLKTDNIEHPEQGNIIAYRTSVDIHHALDRVRSMHIRDENKDSWIEQFPLVKKMITDARYYFSRFLQKLGNFFQKSMPDLSPYFGMSKMTGKVFSFIIATLFAFVALLGVFFVLRWCLAYIEARQAKVLPILNKPFEDTLLINSEYHAEQAQDLAKSEQFSEAIRQVYFASLCLLDERAVLPFDESRTNEEYRQAILYRDASSQENVKDLMSFFDIARYFEFVRYGHYSASASDYQHNSRIYEAFVSSLPKFTPASTKRKHRL